MADEELSLESSGTVSALGKYLILAELGRGGMAEVYLALARGPNGFSKKVVLKLLRTHLAEDDEFLEMFLAEARVAARLNHPNVVQTYEVGIEGGRHCIVMEYLEGRSLAEIEDATRGEKLPVALSARILADALGGLHHAHELADLDGRPLELVHRDVSPHNVFVTYDGQVKVLDFGIAKAADGGSRTKTGVFKGKVRYTAPERFSGEATDRRSDLFSVGVMMWQALTGKRLWPRLNDLAIMHQLASGAPIPRPSELDPTVPPRLEEICMRALAYAPADRYATALEFQDALEGFLSSESVGTTSRVLARFMTEKFHHARAEFQRTVDEQMRVAASIPPDALTGSLSRLRAESAVPVLGFRPSASSGSLSLGLNLSDSVSRVKSHGVAPLSSMAPATQSAAPPEAPPRRGTKGVVVAVLVLLAGGAIAAFVGGPRSERGAPSASGGGAPRVENAAPSAPTPATPPPEASGAVTTEDAVDAARLAAKLPAPPTATSSSAPWRPPPPARRVTMPPPEPPRLPAPKPEPAKREVDCSSPFFVDDLGTKKIRPECL